MSSLSGIIKKKTHLLAYSTRTATDRKEHLFIDAESAESLADQAPRWTSIDEGVDRLLLAIAPRARHFRDPINFDASSDYVRIPAKGDAEAGDLLSFATDLGLLDAKRRITVEGWRRIERLRRAGGSGRQAFVAMWFAQEMDDVWSSGFKLGIERSGYFHALRIDRKEFNGKIDDEIIAEIRRSGLVVADFTGDRGGVYFEAGLGFGLNIPLILTCRTDFANKLHFDTRQYNHIMWETSEELADALDKRIRATILPRAG